MKLKVANTTKFLMSRIGAGLCILISIVALAAPGTRGIEGWYKNWCNGSDFGEAILFFLGFCFLFFVIYLTSFDKTTGSVEFTEDDIIIEKINPSVKFKNGKEIFLKKGKPINEKKLALSEILSIQLLLDSSKEKSKYTREYFKGAENNWLIITMNNGKKYKKELFIKSLAEEKALIDYLVQLNKKTIRISYGTKGKTLLHTIRCAF